MRFITASQKRRLVQVSTRSIFYNGRAGSGYSCGLKQLGVNDGEAEHRVGRRRDRIFDEAARVGP